VTDHVLLDTDVFSYLHKGDRRGAPYRRHLAGADVFLCFQTVAELEFWAESKNWGDKRRRELNAAISKCTVIPYDRNIAVHWAHVTAQRRRFGRPIECGDAWIAATALHHALLLLTHNARDFSGIPGLHVVTYSPS
jgi:predicted nucleic acid-binding protein